MTKFYEQLKDEEKEKYIKEIKKSIDLEKYPKVQSFFENNDLYISNVKIDPIKVKEKKALVILDCSSNKWFILCIDNKICLMAKKNVILHTDIFEYEKRTTNFNKKYNIKKMDYLVEYIDKIGANLSLNVKEYNGKIGKNKWCDDEHEELGQMTLELPQKNPLCGYTYNDKNLSLCIIGKGYDKQKEILC